MGRTDGPTNRPRRKVACTRLKMIVPRNPLEQNFYWFYWFYWLSFYPPAHNMGSRVSGLNLFPPFTCDSYHCHYPWQRIAVSWFKGSKAQTSNTEVAFLVADNRVLKGPLGRSLRSFARTAHSAHSLRSAPLRYARFARSLRSRARSLTSLTPSWDSWNSWICVHAVIALHRNKSVFGCH